jgi:putative nucleotidyltransferase with HDIG domain
MTDDYHYDIETLLNEVVTLPSMPHAVQRIRELLANPNSPLGEVAQAICGDPAIAMKTLRLVNSAYYGLGQEVKTVEHAVVLLGVKVINNLAITATIFNVVSKSTERFLEHSVATGIIMRILAESGPLKAYFKSADEAFIFGLFHDIGKVLLWEYLPKESQRVAESAQSRNIPYFRAEQEILGVDHTEVGARLAALWKLDAMLSNAIAGHHELERCPEEHRPLAASLCIADYISSTAGMGADKNAAFEIPDPVWIATGLSNKELAQAAMRFFEAIPSLRELIALAG